MAEPPRKKPKITSQQTFKAAYTEEWQCIIKSSVDAHHAFCTTCKTDFSIRHSGRYDCKTHVSGAKHKKLEQAKGSSNIASMFKSLSGNTSTASSILKAEAMMAEFIARHNLSLSVADDLPELIKNICATGVAKDIRCARTKTTSLINEMSSIAQDNIICRMKSGPFTVSTDGSNDLGATSKLFPLVVRTVSDTGVHSEVVSVPHCEGSATGEEIFSLLNNFFTEHSIPWKNCMALGCDNANVMTGSKKGLFAFCKDKNPDIILAGCPLHLVHIAAQKGANTLPVNVNDLLVDIYYYFHRSSVRSHRFKEFQELYGEEQSKILKHGPTRWLSIGKCLDRLLKNWDPLKDFFKSEIKRPDQSSFSKSKIEKTLHSLQSRSTRLYLMFLRYSIRPMEQFLILNQADAPKVASIQSECRSLIRQLLTRFVAPSAFGGNARIEDIEYHLPYNLKADKDILVGEDCLSFILNKDNNGLSSAKLKQFYADIKIFFKTVVDYLLKALPVGDNTLGKLSVTDPTKLKSSSSADVRFLANKFPVLMSGSCRSPPASMDDILEEFAYLQSYVPDTFEFERVDEFWIKIKKNGKSSIANFMLGLLTIPHSSAHCERVFSAVRKIKTDQRSLLGTKALESLLVVKHRQDVSFNINNMSVAEINRLKGACSAYNSQTGQTTRK